MARLSTSRAWEESRRVFTHDGGLLTAVALALLVLPDIVAGVVAPSTAGTVSIEGRAVSQEDLLTEIKQTRPLSVIMAEKVEALREWAAPRTVRCD